MRPPVRPGTGLVSEDFEASVPGYGQWWVGNSEDRNLLPHRNVFGRN